MRKIKSCSFIRIIIAIAVEIIIMNNIVMTVIKIQVIHVKIIQ